MTLIVVHHVDETIMSVIIVQSMTVYSTYRISVFRLYCYIIIFSTHILKQVHCMQLYIDLVRITFETV